MALSVRLRPIADSAWHYRRSPCNPALRKYTDRQKIPHSHTGQVKQGGTKPPRGVRLSTRNRKSLKTGHIPFHKRSISERACFCLAKGHVLHHKRARIAKQKYTFYRTLAIGSIRNGNCFPQSPIGLRAFWVSSFVPFMALSVRHRLLAGILFAIFHCRSPLRLQQRATRLPGNQTRPTRTLMTGWG